MYMQWNPPHNVHAFACNVAMHNMQSWMQSMHYDVFNHQPAVINAPLKQWFFGTNSLVKSVIIVDYRQNAGPITYEFYNKYCICIYKV